MGMVYGILLIDAGEFEELKGHASGVQVYIL